MSGFVATGNPYQDYSPPSSGCGCGGACGGNSGLGRHSGTPEYYGMGDLTTIGTDLSNSLSSGDFSAVLADLMPTASITNMLVYGLGIFAWWKFFRKGTGGSMGSSSRRRTLRTARRKAAAIMADAEAA